VLTGTRAEYGLLKPLLHAIQNRSDLRLSLLVTGMHLSREFGGTMKDIERDGFTIQGTVVMNPSKDSLDSMAQAVGRGIIGISKFLQRSRPDLVVVLGDRTEALAGAIASAYMNIPVAHIHGGDTSRGGLDESARHAITKLSHIHFAATPRSALRIERMGEEPWRIHVVGAPGLDSVLGILRLNARQLEPVIGMRLRKPLLLLIQHSVTTQVEQAEAQITETLEAICALRYQTVAISANSDAGGRRINEVLKAYAKKHGFLKVHASVPHDVYINLMRHAAAIIGNSSSAIIEAPALHLGAVNIGIRQEGRERAKNVIDAPHTRVEILRAIRRVLSLSFQPRLRRCKNPYGDGRASQRIVEILRRVTIDEQLVQKKIAY
jgi:UDP-N-acetylglucosamine 2-epimerase (non-hydrolysing)/GDP/UDP-N,N'-diacetylbacillosamine 2-epimerase (hydrolysing)